MDKLLAALIALLIFGVSVNAQKPAKRSKHRLDKGDFKVGYSPKRKSNNQPFGDMKADEKKALQDYADGLNKRIALPRDIYLNADVCGKPNAFYKPAISEITLCYEFIEEFRKHFRKFAKEGEDPDAMVSSTITFVFYHELGHCLIDVWDLPATGREEDAVDQLAIVYVLRDQYISEKLVIDAANFFSLASEEQKSKDDLVFSDEHSFNEQRFYNMMCLMYGSSPEKYKWMIAPDQLPAERADRCPAEYDRANRAWSRLLKPYLIEKW